MLTGETYQWGTGAIIGSNIITGQTSISIVLNPIITTTYWVRVIATSTLITTAAALKTVTLVIPSPVVKDSQCGTTLLNLDSSFYPNTVTAAQAYRYQITNGASVLVYEPAALFNLTLLPDGATYNTTYIIQVAVKIYGTWGSFGLPCNITTPSPITKIKTANCGITLAAINTSVYADTLINVQGYRFEVTKGSTVRTFESTSNLFNLNQLVGGATYSTTYTIRVAAKANGIWGPYGSFCFVSTPGAALTKVIDSQCGTTLSILNSSIYCVSIYGAQSYRYEITNGANVRTYDLNNTTSLFNLTQLTGGAAYNTTYSVRVSSKVNGVWSAYGTACNVNTPATITKVKALFCGTTLATSSTSIYADAISGVQGYRFEITNGTTVRTVDAVSNLFNLTQLVGGAAAGTTYSIRVAALTNGVYGAYGTTCNVSTPVPPAARQSLKSTEILLYTSVFTVRAYPNPFTDNFKLKLTSESNNNVEIIIYDLVGKLISRNTVQAENVNNTNLGDELHASAYTIIVNQRNDFKTIRIIKR